MEYMAKWHRELGIFCRIKPLIIVEGNVLDVYRYPVEGSRPKGSIIRLPEYLYAYFSDLGYQTIVFFDGMQGFYNNFEEGHIQAFAEMTKGTPLGVLLEHLHELNVHFRGVEEHI